MAKALVGFVAVFSFLIFSTWATISVLHKNHARGRKAV